VDSSPAGPPVAAVRIWAGLDEPWRDAFRQAWEALRTGNIAVGACASTADGEIICSARNRVNDGEGPVGEIFGSALAHAEANVLARLPFGSRRDLVLTTTLQPCLQCAGAIRLGPVATVRFAGPDRYWDGCHDFGKLSAREARRAQPARIGPRRDELGTFATLISRIAHLPPATSRLCGPWATGRWLTWCTNWKTAVRWNASPPWTSPMGSDTCGPGSRN
jgi:tRNA(adenine34) deaminase